MAAENPNKPYSGESSKRLPYHASVFCIAANEAEIVASSVYNMNFNSSMVYQDMDDLSDRFNRFVEDTQKRWESKTTSYTPPDLERDIDRIRMIAERLKDHLGMYGSNQEDNVAETFQGSLGKIQDLLERTTTHPKQPQLSTISVPSRRLDRLAPPALERIPEIYGASDWADEELSLRRAREQSQGFVQEEASTTLLESKRLAGSFREGILSHNLSVKNDKESETSSVLADSIRAVATTSATNCAATVRQTYTSGLRRAHVQPLDVEREDEQHPNSTQSSLVSRHSMQIIYKSSLAVFSILVPILAIALAVLTFIPLFIETAQLGPEWESVLTKYQFTKDLLRNWGPAGLLIVSIFHEHSNALDHGNLKAFVGLLTMFLVLNGCSIVLEATGRSSYAIMAVDLSDILLLLTTFFYFEWVLRRH